MNPVVVEVGPVTVRGPDPVPAEWVSEALECLGDRIAILDDRLVDVGALWRDVLAAAGGQRAQPLALVLPSWWSTAREETVAAAARKLTPDVVVRRRGPVLSATNGAVVVELGDDFAVVAQPGRPVQTLDRENLDAAALSALGPALLDVPAGVAPLRSADAVECTDRQRVLAAVAASLPRARALPRRRTVAVLAGSVLSAAAAGGGWFAQSQPQSPAAPLLVEGRVAMQVPPRWTVERITAGPGSARVQISAPGGTPALHLTQSVTGAPTTLPDTAESLRKAIESAPAGIFIDFVPDGEVGGRAAVTYRELRAGSQTDWAVVVDGNVRIAVGCQSAPGQEHSVRDMCAQAVRSAHAVR